VLADISRISPTPRSPSTQWCRREPAKGEKQVDIIMLPQTREKASTRDRQIENYRCDGQVTRIRLESCSDRMETLLNPDS